VRALDHVVLLVAAQAMLGAKGGGQADVRTGGERVQAVGQAGGDRSRVSQEGDAAANEGAAQFGLGEQAVDAESHGRSGYGAGSSTTKPSAWWKSGRPGAWATAQ